MIGTPYIFVCWLSSLVSAQDPKCYSQTLDSQWLYMLGEILSNLIDFQLLRALIFFFNCLWFIKPKIALDGLLY